jgi:hypothetical protein
MQTPPNYQQYQPNYQPYPTPQKPKDNNSILAIIAMAVAGVALILGIITCIATFSKKTADTAITFDVENFTQDRTDYDYINLTSYSGKGDVYTDDRDNVYIVVLKVMITSGGGSDSEDVTYQMVQVSNGKGKFSTYDSGDTSNYSEPNYKFEVIGYVKLDQPEE